MALTGLCPVALSVCPNVVISGGSKALYAVLFSLYSVFAHEKTA